MIDVSPGKIAGVKLIRPAAQHDLRGTFVKTMHWEIFSEHGIPMQYAEQYYSVSKNRVCAAFISSNPAARPLQAGDLHRRRSVRCRRRPAQGLAHVRAT